ncbi:MAG TPA: MarR family transcriptional regulator [Mucilaginibacter sp.]|jgi:DNA-binding MarR family transcriptional regulator|nr:MarR family transcriptional regulator [Mucilaginibacter sp.]
MEKLNDIIFYHLDKAIKTYRQFAQKRLKQAGINLTIDQWMVLKTIVDHPGISQRDIAANVFKDEAAVTRIIDLLVKKELLSRSFHSTDRRRIELNTNANTKKLLKEVNEITLKNRAIALDGVTPADLEMVKNVLTIISANCNYPG